VNEYPRWSPDGNQLLFYRWTIGSDGVPTGSALYLVDADGENLREITAPPFAGDAEWSPDGSQIAFGTYPWHADRMGDVPGRAPNVYTVRSDGTDLVQLTTDDISSAPSWTSDGRILFVRGPLNRGIVASDLWLMDADGQNQHQITHYLGSEGQCCSFYAAVQPTP
jgi:Tol biopolymer transport system component